jgi:hypothetical protein
LDAKRVALKTLSRKASAGGYVTQDVTKSGAEGDVRPEVLENTGRPERARTADLYRVKVAL